MVLDKEKAHYVLRAWGEVAICYILALVLCITAFISPETLNLLGLHGDNQLKLSLQLCTAFLHLVSCLMVAFRAIRFKRNTGLKEDSIEIKETISQEVNERLKSPYSAEDVKFLYNAPSMQKRIDEHFEPILNFDRTERIVIKGGLIMFAIGSLLQVFTAG